MVRVGEIVRWQCPTDADYSYGTVMEIKKSVALVRGSGYYAGVITEVALHRLEKVERGGKKVGSDSKKYSKRSTPKIKL